MPQAEQGLRRVPTNEQQLETSERIAYLSDIAWRRRHGQRPDPRYASPAAPISALDAARVEQVVSALDELAPRWNQLVTGGELAFTWPSLVPQLG